MNKYFAKKVKYDGITFDSKKEYERFLELKALEDHGKIQDLMVHVPITIFQKNKYGRKVWYECDFVYKLDGETIYEDVKSKATITRVYKLKKRCLQELRGITITEYL